MQMSHIKLVAGLAGLVAAAPAPTHAQEDPRLSAIER